MVWAFAGVRSLHDDGAGRPEDVDARLSSRARPARRCGAAAHRLRRQDHDLPAARGGGARQACACFPMSAALDRDRAAARGRISSGTASTTLVAQALRDWPFLDEANALRLARAYGTRVHRIFGAAARREDAAPWFGPLSAAEVRYLMAARVGAHRRGRAVAAQQARPAPDRNGEGGSGAVHGRTAGSRMISDSGHGSTSGGSGYTSTSFLDFGRQNERHGRSHSISNPMVAFRFIWIENDDL